MSEEVKPVRKRKTREEMKAALLGKVRALEERGELSDKKLLLFLADRANELAKKRPSQPQIGQAANLLSTAAGAIRASIPQ